jgi:hypothetical protein
LDARSGDILAFSGHVAPQGGRLRHSLSSKGGAKRNGSTNPCGIGENSPSWRTPRAVGRRRCKDRSKTRVVNVWVEMGSGRRFFNRSVRRGWYPGIVKLGRPRRESVWATLTRLAAGPFHAHNSSLDRFVVCRCFNPT